MSQFNEKMSKRFSDLILEILKMERTVCKTFSGRHIFGQLFRAATSSGANYEEARAGESKADFIHKMQIVLKELRETTYWLKLLSASDPKTINLKDLINESKELMNIIAKAIVTAKTKM